MLDDLKQAALDYHRYPRPGKIEVTATKPLATQRDLALAYTPGVAMACEAIVQGEKSLVKQFVVACKRGPTEASVDRIETEPLTVDPRLGGFHVER